MCHASICEMSNNQPCSFPSPKHNLLGIYTIMTVRINGKYMASEKAPNIQKLHKLRF